MTVGNRYNKNAPMLKRPKVCESEPPPVEEPSPVDCDVFPPSLNVLEFDVTTPDVFCYDPSLSPEEQITVHPGDGSVLSGENTIWNSVSPTQIVVDVVASPGSYNVRWSFRHNGQELCHKVTPVAVDPLA